MGVEDDEFFVERFGGLDVHKRTVAAMVRFPGPKGGRASRTATFQTTVQGLLELSDWLGRFGVTLVRMESTGVSRKPVFFLLEERFERWLLNARHLHNVPGDPGTSAPDGRLRHVMLHELGHAHDFAHLDRDEQERWMEARDLSGDWSPSCSGCDDRGHPAGDWAESFAACVSGDTEHSPHGWAPHRTPSSAACSTTSPPPGTGRASRSSGCAVGSGLQVTRGGVRAPGGLRGLQRRWEGRRSSGGFDSRPPPPPATRTGARTR